MIKIELAGYDWLTLFNLVSQHALRITSYKDDLVLTVLNEWLQKKIMPKWFEYSTKFKTEKKFKLSLQYTHAAALLEYSIKVDYDVTDEAEQVLRRLILQLDQKLTSTTPLNLNPNQQKALQ